jgi:N utilization substance protein B
VDWANDMIKSHLQNWEFDRVAQIDQVLLRMGICEIFYMDDIPLKVSISEMVEISKVYSTEESSGFINGILDAVYKEFQQKNKN